MSEAEIMMKRLLEMKKLSAQLKDKSDNSSTVDYMMLKKIMNATKLVANNQAPYFQEINKPKRVSERSSGLYSFENYNRDIKSNHQKLTLDQQDHIIVLTQQNAQLSKMNLNLSKEIQSLKQINKDLNAKIIEKQNKIPYFQFEEQLDVFTTKIPVKQEDYIYVEYQTYIAKLQLAQIIISHQKSSYQKTLKLSQLTHVKYHEDNIMIIQFQSQDNSNTETLFIKCKNIEKRHRWDLGIFINHKIISCIEKKRLFQEIEKQDSNNQINVQEKKQKNQQPLQIQDKSLIKSYIQSKQKLLKVRKELNNQILQKIIEKKGDLKTHSRQNSKQLDINSQHNQINQNKQPSNLWFSTSPSSKKQATYPSLVSETSKKDEAAEAQRIKKQQEQMIIEQQAKEKLMKLKEAQFNLKSGYQLMKYAEGGWEPHQKKVYLSFNDNLINFQDLKNKKDLKKYSIGDIQSIEYMSYGKGVQKHVKNPQSNNFVKITIKDKIIELGHPKANLVWQFSDELSRIYEQFIRKNK